MRKTLLPFLLAMAFLPMTAISQTAIIQDDFESYTAGQLLATNSSIWTTWTGDLASEDAYVSSTYAVSGSNSVNVVGYYGPTDLILPFPQDYTSGVYEVSLKMLITSGNGGYFNIQASSTPAVEWMFEIYFDAAGDGYINAGGSGAATFTYSPDQWFSINIRADLDKDTGELFINSHSIHSWQWSTGALGTSSINQIGGVNIYSYTPDGSDADMYIDNVMLSQITTTGIFVDDFEKYTPGQLLSANSDIWKTWSGDLAVEDAFVTDEFSNSGFNSFYITGSAGPTDLFLPFADYTTGVYDLSFKMYIVSAYGGYFNIQQSSTTGVGYMFEIYFDNAGGGYINAGGTNAATVSYTPDTWTDIKLKIDLTNDVAELWINFNSIYTWQWSTGSSGTGTVNSLGGVNFYAAAANGQTALYYVDDVVLAEGFPTGITTETLNPDILISPNPTTGPFTVAINDLDAGEYQLQLIDVSGRILGTEMMTVSGSMKKDFNLNLANGVYYLKLTNGSYSITRRVIIN